MSVDDAMRERLRADVLSALHRGISEGADIRRPGADEHPYLTPEEALAAIEAAAEARGREAALAEQHKPLCWLECHVCTRSLPDRGTGPIRCTCGATIDAENLTPEQRAKFWERAEAMRTALGKG